MLNTGSDAIVIILKYKAAKMKIAIVPDIERK